MKNILIPQHTPIEEMPIFEVVGRVESLNRGLAEFWSKSDGWAPVSAAGLLGKSRLDWQVSLSGALRLWTSKTNPLSPAELILAWTNLGSLIEGTIKLLLSVYYENFRTDIENAKKANAFDRKKLIVRDPDGLLLDQLRKYCELRSLLGTDGDKLVSLVQQRRNAIHAFKDRPIGTEEEFAKSVRGYLKLLRDVNNRLPYPDDMYVPQEEWGANFAGPADN